MSIEITIKCDALAASISELAASIKLYAAAAHEQAKADGAELSIPAGTPMTVAEVKPAEPEQPAPEPEKPKRKRVSKQAAEMLAESAQEPAGEPAAPEAPAAPAEPEQPAESPVEAAAETWETVADHPAAADIAAEASNAPTMAQISEAGAKLLDDNPAAMQPLLGLLRDFGVQAITQLKQEQLADFAARLRKLGAEV